MDQTLILIGVLLFVAVALGLEGAYQAYMAKHGAEAKRLINRMRLIEGTADATPLSIERVGRRTQWVWLEDLIDSFPLGANLTRLVDTSGVAASASTLVALSALLGAFGFALPWLVGRPVMLLSLFFALVLGSMPWLWLSWRRGKFVKTFERQIPEALDLMGRALRAGHAFPTAIKMVGEEMPDPVGREFRVLFDETNFGMPQTEALTRLADRVPVEDMRYFVIAVTIQRESGGNLAELLDNIASIVRARLKLLGDIRTLSAEGKMSAWILGLLPFVMAGAIGLVNPKFLSTLWNDPAGLRLIGGALVMMFLGVLWMRKIIRIRV